MTTARTCRTGTGIWGNTLRNPSMWNVERSFDSKTHSLEIHPVIDPDGTFWIDQVCREGSTDLGTRRVVSE